MSDINTETSGLVDSIGASTESTVTTEPIGGTSEGQVTENTVTEETSQQTSTESSHVSTETTSETNTESTPISETNVEIPGTESNTESVPASEEINSESTNSPTTESSSEISTNTGNSYLSIEDCDVEVVKCVLYPNVNPIGYLVGFSITMPSGTQKFIEQYVDFNNSVDMDNEGIVSVAWSIVSRSNQIANERLADAVVGKKWNPVTNRLKVSAQSEQLTESQITE